MFREFALFVYFVCLSASAAPVLTEIPYFQQPFGGSIQAVVSDSAGNIYITGSTRGGIPLVNVPLPSSGTGYSASGLAIDGSGKLYVLNDDGFLLTSADHQRRSKHARGLRTDRRPAQHTGSSSRKRLQLSYTAASRLSWRIPCGVLYRLRSHEPARYHWRSRHRSRADKSSNDRLRGHWRVNVGLVRRLGAGICESVSDQFSCESQSTERYGYTDDQHWRQLYKSGNLVGAKEVTLWAE